jgi:2-oxoglutarate dehydrogenase E2 component (dihydrolipoamide succinyltransferase)
VAKVTMPQLGESVAEGTIGKWLKQPGDHVDVRGPCSGHHRQGQCRGPSPFEGVLKEILAEEGATVPNNAEIAVIETADEGSTNGASAPVEAKSATPAAAKPEEPAVKAEQAAFAPEARRSLRWPEGRPARRDEPCDHSARSGTTGRIGCDGAAHGARRSRRAHDPGRASAAREHGLS